MIKTQTTKKSGEEIVVGDIIIVLGYAHRIVEIEPYAHPTLEGAIGIARASDGWGISLWAGSGKTLEVA